MNISKFKAMSKKPLSVQDLSEKATSKGLKKKNQLDRTTIEALIEEKAMIDEKIKTLNERKSTISERIQEIAETNGVKDSNGSFNFRFEYNDEEYIFSKNARTSRKFNPEKALDFFKNKKKNLFSLVVDTIEVVNEQKVESLLVANKITTSDLEKLFDEKVTYAGLLNKVKEEKEPEPETTKVVQSTRNNPSRRSIRR